MSGHEDQLGEMISQLPIFIGTEQPETCRNCGTLTEFDEVTDQQQLHQCARCGNQYVLDLKGSGELHKYIKP